MHFEELRAAVRSKDPMMQTWKRSAAFLTVIVVLLFVPHVAAWRSGRRYLVQLARAMKSNPPLRRYGLLSISARKISTEEADLKHRTKPKPMGRVSDDGVTTMKARKGQSAGSTKPKYTTGDGVPSMKDEPAKLKQIKPPAAPAATTQPSQQPRMIPPEVVFFGEPRSPPPASLADDLRYHGSLLYWARHATVAPKDSSERLDRVFPKGRQHPLAGKYRLACAPDESGSVSSSKGLTYDEILAAFEKVSDDLQAAKAFIDSNCDIILPRMFLRALTAHKLAAQSRGDVDTMHKIKTLRGKYIAANNELFFPLNIEVQKAETRVMSYLGRPEMLSFAQDWDAVEMSLYFATLLTARYKWDERVRQLKNDIDKRVDATVGYMADRLRGDLLDKEFRGPATTAELYRNASAIIQQDLPALYGRVLPELRLLQEVYGAPDDAATVRYVREVFCPREGLAEDALKERLRLVDAAVGNIQGSDYIPLRVRIQSLYRMLCTEDELDHYVDAWYNAFLDDTRYDFETYEPDEIPALIQLEQRLRDTGNAFTNFAVEVLQMPTFYTESFSGKRKKAKQVGDWLSLDPDLSVPLAKSDQEKVDRFLDAYIEQTRLRKAAEAKLGGDVGNAMEAQDRMLEAPSWASAGMGLEDGVMEYSGEDS